MGWNSKGKVSFLFNQAAFSNWAAGGENSISGTLGLNYNINYHRENWDWDNRIIAAYGLTQTKNSKFVKKTDDRFEVNSIIGKKGKNNWFYSGFLNFRTQITKGYRYNTDENGKEIRMKRYNAELDSINLGYKIRYKRQITSIVTFDGKKTDSIFPYSENRNLTILGEAFEDENSQTIKSARTFAEFEFVEKLNDSVFVNSIDLEIKTKDIIVITDWKSIVFRRMATLLICSVLLFLFVIGLLYYSIKNLINQKKITEIKTDFINNITHDITFWLLLLLVRFSDSTY